MPRARASNLMAHPADHTETRELKHVGQVNPRANFGKVNSRHRSRPEKRNLAPRNLGKEEVDVKELR